MFIADACRRLKLAPSEELLGRTILCCVGGFTEILTTIVSCAARSGTLELVITHQKYSGEQINGIHVHLRAEPNGNKHEASLETSHHFYPCTVDFV